uniref:Uncharacterized protein n=1 Tax=Solanum tuberosum TaxID=4113 RepID=M1DZL8_SOLTU
MMETKATIWVHLNVIKLGQAFGAAMGCEKEAYALCMKMDQKKNLERCAGKGKTSDNNNYTIPKELKDCVLECSKARRGEHVTPFLSEARRDQLGDMRRRNGDLNGGAF